MEIQDLTLPSPDPLTLTGAALDQFLEDQAHRKPEYIRRGELRALVEGDTE